ncbi:conserved haemoplasma hypothetical protein,fragment [Candidatus Mycoplasma haemominutum 'Birmingham 1']|uniref:Uncharacterized protein n=1 Tax=Candidatus Mycoplasma haematominutum 'Birmingham 1' TaxID=1116213 RepID=G8C2H1_9MOLU|nr:conserved haemoplasma hypothetical protein,fragment [Candidatus Mycoplasma haematominutum 'Birmingham 1']
MFIIVSSIIIAISVAPKVRNLFWEYVLRFFVSFRIFEYFSFFFNEVLFWKMEKAKAFEEFKNTFQNYRRYVYGLLFIFTLENFRIITRYFYTRNRWDRFSLSYGLYENKTFLRIKKELLSTLGNVLSFGVSLVVFFVIVGFAVFKTLSKKFTFENNFIFEGMIFAFFFWIAFVIFFSLNLYQRMHNYYRNYLKNNVIDQKKDAWVCFKTMTWHYLLNIFMFVAIALNIPIDLFVVFAILKFIPWQLIFNHFTRDWENNTEKQYFNLKGFLSFS